MSSWHRFSVGSLLLTSLSLTGCYTQLAGRGDGWGYTGERHEEVVRQERVVTDTVVVEHHPAVAAAEVKNDTVYVDDDRTRSDYTYPHETIVNNYYYNDPIPADYYWYPRYHRQAEIAIYFGSPRPH